MSRISLKLHITLKLDVLSYGWAITIASLNGNERENWLEVQ
jgi:hypothetical protein